MKRFLDPNTILIFISNCFVDNTALKINSSSTVAKGFVTAEKFSQIVTMMAAITSDNNF